MQRYGAAPILLFLAFISLVTSGSSQLQCTSSNLFYAHQRNCDMYYKCENGTVREGICPDGLVFDDKQPPDVLKCDLPFDVDCSYRAALQPPQSTEHCPRMYGLYAHETDCTRFWQCVEGHPFAFYCPEGLAYNEYSAHCDWPDQVENCDSEALLQFRCPQPTDQELQDFGDPRYPYPGDCRKHYVCVLNPDGSRKPRLLACDPGLVFNPKTSSCDDPENVPGCQGYYNNLDARRLRELFGRR
ncbi:protein obstructor-E [Nephila pilipes]|uniref:Protein obstructor-E n=1 Tax=Nephila pilipes TaxID=299642 RepID=A0A8X6PYJ1_NEPPI|nr:protein obstructor-E [Nephila pilipes]